MNLWSTGSALTPPDTMRKGFTPTGTSQTRGKQTLRKVKKIYSRVCPMQFRNEGEQDLPGWKI